MGMKEMKSARIPKFAPLFSSYFPFPHFRPGNEKSVIFDEFVTVKLPSRKVKRVRMGKRGSDNTAY